MSAALHQTFADLSRVPDNWSCEYEFEELEIELDKVLLGSFNGTAELAINDIRDGDFCVKHIVVTGDMRTKRPGSIILWRTQAHIQLPRPSDEDRSFKAHLFRHLAAALYKSDRAVEFFRNERSVA